MIQLLINIDSVFEFNGSGLASMIVAIINVGLVGVGLYVALKKYNDWRKFEGEKITVERIKILKEKISELEGLYYVCYYKWEEVNHQVIVDYQNQVKFSRKKGFDLTEEAFRMLKRIPEGQEHEYQIRKICDTITAIQQLNDLGVLPDELLKTYSEKILTTIYNFRFPLFNYILFNSEVDSYSNLANIELKKFLKSLSKFIDHLYKIDNEQCMIKREDFLVP